MKMGDLNNIPDDPKTYTMHRNINKLYELSIVTEQTAQGMGQQKYTD